MASRRACSHFIFTLILLPLAAFAQVQKDLDVFIPIPDGEGGTVNIRSCIIHQPGDLATLSPSPVVFEWTSYSLTPNSRPAGGCPPQYGSLANQIVPEGYIFVAANPRGIDISGEDDDLSENWGTRDGVDGANIVEWIADQSWSNGKVGVVGCSNSAMHALQLAVAAAAIPNSELDTIAPSCAALDSYRGAFYPGGMRNWTVWTFFARAAVDVTYPIILDQLSRGEFFWAQRILSDTETASEVFLNVYDDQTPGAFWEDHSTRNTVDQITVPIQWSATWHDFFRGGPENAMLHFDAARGDRVAFYPGWHGAHLGVPGPYSGMQRTKQWLDFHLRDIPLPYAAEKPIIWWENQGGSIPGIAGTELQHRFYQTDVWPPADVAYQRWYLQPGRVGASDGSLNDGGLSQDLPPGDITNVGDPYPYPCGACPGASNDPTQGVGTEVGWSAAVEDAGGAVVYTTEPMQQAMHIAGPITVNLWATSTAVDTDFVVKLLSQDPEGNFQHISNGWLKASHRAEDPSKTIYNGNGEVIRPYHPHTEAAAELIPLPGPLDPPGPVPVEYVIEVWQTAVEIPVGHRLKIWVSSTEVPWFFQEIPPAINTILHDPAHPSSVLLPVIPASSLEAPGEDGIFLGSGFYQETVEINRLLTYTAPLGDVIQLPAGTTELPLAVRYSPFIDAGSFEASINFDPTFVQQFEPSPGAVEIITVPLQPGNNDLRLRAVVGDPDGNRDGARMVKDLDVFSIQVGP